jgi:MtN3 and saliva related transmembrane protein
VTTVSIVGISASLLTAISSIPQLIKLIREKKAEAVSVPMFLVLITGLACWIYYGILKEDWILILSNSFSLLINLSVTLLALKYKK